MEYYLAQFQIIEAAGREADAIRDIVVAVRSGDLDELPSNPNEPSSFSAPHLPNGQNDPKNNQHTPLDKLAIRFREATTPNEAGIPPIIALTDACPMLNKFIWASGGCFFWETIAENNGWKLQRNKFLKHFRVRDPDKTCRACGWKRRMRRLFFPEVFRKAEIKVRPTGRQQPLLRMMGLVVAGVIVVGVIIGISFFKKRHFHVVDLGKGQRIRLVPCPAGEFWMGSPEWERGRFPNEERRLASIKRFFWAGETEVTQGQWKALMGGTVRDKAAALKADGAQIVGTCGPYDGTAPMYFVSWDDANRFCRKLSSQERKKGLLPDGYEYRLPTEEEWEYLCRAGTQSAYPNDRDMEGSGDSNEPNLNGIAWFAGNSRFGKGKEPFVHPCRECKPNKWGFHDTVGNVWEWCQNAYADQGPPNAMDGVLERASDIAAGVVAAGVVGGPVGMVGNKWFWKKYDETKARNDDIMPWPGKRSIRGGAWNSDARTCRSASRRGFFQQSGRNDIGFRIVLAPALQNP